MDAALYDSEDGFFVRRDLVRGPGSDFVTSPEVSPLFGEMVARHASRLWCDLGRPERMRVVEAGGGRGALASAFLKALASDRSADTPPVDSVEYVIADPAASIVDSDLPVSLVDSIESVSGPLDGLVFANELLDNLPARLFEFSNGAWSELLVGVVEGSLTFRRSSPVDGLSLDSGVGSGSGSGVGSGVGTRLPEQGTEGEVIAVSEAADTWVSQAAALIGRGEILLVDYPRLDRPAGQELIRTFDGHARGSHPLDRPGEQDITVSVDWGRVTAGLVAAGLDTSDQLTQHHWLTDLGIGDVLEALRDDELAALREGRHMEALAIKDRRMGGLALLDPAGLGSFTVLSARRGL